MKASSASGLWARRIVRGGSAAAATGAFAGRRLGRLVAEGVEVLRVLAVLGPLARPLRGLMVQEVTVRPPGIRRAAFEPKGASAQHEREEMGGHCPPDGV